MTDREFADLCIDIAANGLREPIWTFDGMIIDGRNRYNACIRAKVDPQFRLWPGEKEKLTSFVVSLNLNRRHLNESQRAMVAAKMAKLDRGRPNLNTAIADKLTQSKAAELLNVSQDSIGRAVKVKEKGLPELVEMVEAGQISVSKAAAIASMSKKKQHNIIKKGRNAGKKMITKLRIESLKNSDRGFRGCLRCNPEARWDDNAVAAHMEDLSQRNREAIKRVPETRNYTSLFEDAAGEIAELTIAEIYRDNRDKILAAIDAGASEEGDIAVRERTDLQRVTKIPWPEFNHAISMMLDYKVIEVFTQGRITDNQRGAVKTLYRRSPNPPVHDFTIEFDEDEAEIGEIFDPLAI